MVTACLILLAVLVVIGLAFVLGEIFDFSTLGLIFFMSGTAGQLVKVLFVLVAAIAENLTGRSEA
ncbi:MAG: hypothetical protein C0467_31470 [Planctomycetaceae bacterium]|nr:hypothetical protein [Planctomycetaceae bacterium]